MQIIYSYVEPWVVDQNVYLMSDGLEPVMLEKVPLENLSDYIALTYAKEHCDKIILHGSTYGYTMQIADDIKTYGLNNYGLNNINIEVVK